MGVYPCVVMFASYAWLFSKLYFDSKKPRGKSGKAEGMARSISRAISVAVLDDDDDENSQNAKKVNWPNGALGCFLPKVVERHETSAGEHSIDQHKMYMLESSQSEVKRHCVQ